ncbi:MAG: YCF48-related protein [Candidatus Margulisiibacteriota bacterium]
MIKKLYFILAALIIFCAPSFSAVTWVTKVSSTDVYNKIVAITPERAFVIGNGGKVGYTSNYGDFTFASWDPTNTNALRDIFFYTTSEAKMVGDVGTVVSVSFNQTTGAYSYATIFSPPGGASLEGCTYTADDGIFTLTGYDSSGNGGIWRSSDGMVWTRSLDELNTRYKRIYCTPTAMTGYVVGAKYDGANMIRSVLTTSDGDNWAAPATWVVSPASAQQGYINDLQNYDASNSGGARKWIVGSGGFVYYYDGTWSDKSISGGPDLYGVYFTSLTNGWVVGDGGKAYHTTDGGANWTLTQLDSGYTLESVSLSGEANGWIVGKSAAGSKIYNLSTVPSSLEIQNVKLDGVTLESSGSGISITKSSNRSAIAFEIAGTSSISNFPLTAEVIATKSGSTATTYQILASEIITREGSSLATVESKQLATFEVGTYTCVVNAYYTTLTASKTFTLTVAYIPAPVDTSKPISDPIPAKVFGPADTTATFTITVKADADIDWSKVSSVIVAPGIEDVIVGKATIVPHAGSLKASRTGAAASDSYKATVTFNLPSHMPRAIYSFMLKDDRNGAGIMRPSRFAYARTSN